MPTKAAYLRFEADPELEFEFLLARDLRMTVEELRRRMGHDEFVAWGVYYGRRAQREEMERKRAGGG